MISHRRPGPSPGRWALLALELIIVAMLALPGAAMGQTVVEATVLGRGSEGAAAEPVTVQALGQCPQYSGSNPITLYPSQQPEEIPATSWALSDVLTCALRIPAGTIDSVQVFSPQHGYERPLSPADLTNAGQYRDPTAPQALPVIYTDGGQDLNTFTRPWRGGGDANGSDHVTESQAPVSVVVFTNGTPLDVRPSQRAIGKSGQSFAIRLHATVTDAGSPVSAADLRWHWNFADGSGSAQAGPTHIFANGVYAVTVLVTDRRSGRGGTATLQVGSATQGPQGHEVQTGGRAPTSSRSSTGSDHSHFTKPSASAGPGTQPSPDAGRTPRRAQRSQERRTASAAGTPSRPRADAPQGTRQPHQRSTQHPRLRGRSRPAPPRGGRLITGRLVADVMPVEGGSQLLTPFRPSASRPRLVVRQARTAPTSPVALLAAVTVLVLLGLGAVRESRGTRSRGAPRTDD